MGFGGRSTLQDFMDRRFDADHWLGRHVTLGLLMAILSLGGFGSIAKVSLDPAAPLAIDETVKSYLHRYAVDSRQSTETVKGITTLGNHDVMLMFGLGLMAALVVRRQSLLAAGWLVLFLGGALLTHTLKIVFQRPRPDFPDPIVFHGDFSFPSGHTMGSLVCYGLAIHLLLGSRPQLQRSPGIVLGALVVTILVFVVRWVRPVPAADPPGGMRSLAEVWEIAWGLVGYLILLTPLHPWARRTLVAVLAMLIVGIGASRFYLGAHWFSDVIGGWLAATCWLALGITIIATLRRQATKVASVPPGSQSEGVARTAGPAP
jgi:undecaprenyl-diphosphatase